MEVVSLNVEKPVYFQSRGKRLFGILHNAENNSRSVGIIFLNSGLLYRIGPNRIYVKIARRLSQLGFSSLRLDFPGIGDSEGVIKDIDFDLFDTEDTIRAIDYLTKEEEIEKVVLLGICAGARNALKTAAHDLRVDSIVSLSLPIITDMEKFSETRLSNNEAISRIAAKNCLKRWLKKSLSKEAWRRYITHNNSSPSVRSVLWKLLTGKKIHEDNRYKMFFEAFETFISSKRKALFVYGERDVISKEEFEVKFEELSKGKRHKCEYYIVSDSNHNFTSKEAERNVIEKTVKWLTQQYELHKEGLEE